MKKIQNKLLQNLNSTYLALPTDYILFRTRIRKQKHLRRTESPEKTVENLRKNSFIPINCIALCL